MSEWNCVCQSKNGRTGICNVVPKYQEELKVYKKALELACKELYMRDDFCIGVELKKFENCGNCKECWKKYFLQKAGEENDT